MAKKRSVRKGQVIAPFGPGGIFDFGDESFMALDISEWKPKAYSRIRDLPRLQNLLGVLQLCEPKTAPDNSWQESDLSNVSVQPSHRS